MKQSNPPLVMAMMTKNTKDWLVVYLIPYAAIGAPTLGMGLLLPFMGLPGIVIGLASSQSLLHNQF